MPKRPSDTPAPGPAPLDKIMKKTERSHEENQERAYIAASRRADRSIEARVQSARMASEIHKKRTGKGFKISEEIVMKEEMYEEEEDDLPRQYRALAAHMQTSNGELNSRLSAYITSNVAMRTLAREQEVHRMFAEQFPNASQISQQLSRSMYMQPLLQQQQQQQQHQSPISPTFPEMNYAADQFKRERSHSIAPSVDMSPRTSIAMAPSPSPAMRNGSLDGPMSPPVLSPGSQSTETTQSTSLHRNGSSYQSSTYSARPSTAATAEPLCMPMPSMPTSSSFTSEFPPELKQLAGPGLDWNDPMTSSFLGLDGGFGGDSSFDWMNYVTMPGGQSTMPAMDDPTPKYFFDQDVAAAAPSFDLPASQSTVGTPGAGGDSWESWLHTDQFAAEDQH